MIVVLCIIVLLTIILFGFSVQARTRLRAAERFGKSQQALACARAGISVAVAAICDTNDLYADPKHRTLLTGENSCSLGTGEFCIKLAQENGKINVNALRDPGGKLNRARVDQLLRLIDLLNRDSGDQSGLSYSLVPAIIDWIDADDDTTHLDFVKGGGTGAESGYYESASPARRCKNRPLDAIEELLAVKGMTPETLSRLAGSITTKGAGLININAAPEPVIESLSEKMDAVVAQMIVNRRKVKPFESLTELRDVPGMTDQTYESIARLITVAPKQRYFRATSQGTIGDYSCTVVAVLKQGDSHRDVKVVSYKEI